MHTNVTININDILSNNFNEQLQSFEKLFFTPQNEKSNDLSDHSVIINKIEDFLKFN